MVSDNDWPAVCTGLVSAGVCCFLTEDEAFKVNGEVLVNGLFGVSKDEVSQEGFDVYRLIMNLIPLNQLCEPLAGDVHALPSWALMNPFHLQPGETLLVSSEEVKCFFYTMRVPQCWWKYLCFSKLVPEDCLPAQLKGQRVYLASTVLPMGFVNSVSIAQHVHRNLVEASREFDPGSNLAEAELRKDRPFTVSNPSWRIYLDNYDLLEKDEATGMGSLRETVAPGVLALRQQYEAWNVPRNEKKSVSRSSLCEVQGATVDGCAGLAYPRESKLVKYLSLGYALAGQSFVSQRQLQVVCGGLVYFSMFRRPLLGTLNRVWSFMEEFNHVGVSYLANPADCQLEVLRFLGLSPLAAMSFRLEVDGMVTCSDASTTGGGICQSVGVSEAGSHVANGSLRGKDPASHVNGPVLSIGLFDGIGALRVGLDVLGIPVLGHVSVEKSREASRVVEDNFLDSLFVDSVEAVTDEMVRGWSLKYSQAVAVILGGGPPCQGVSGLNSDRKGALKDARSSLFVHVSRIRGLLRKHFRWAPVYSLMESVGSMGQADQEVMSEDFGDVPIRLDAGCFTWCNRPCLYWVNWNLQESEVAWVDSVGPDGLATWKLAGAQSIEGLVEPGWIKDILDACHPGGSCSVQGCLVRLPLGPQKASNDDPLSLVTKLSNLVSMKGEDVMLSAPTSQVARHHRLRASIPSRLWKWKVVTGWQWTLGKERINALELKAVLTTVRWRTEHLKQTGKRSLRLTDSLVVLHALTRGRSSSRKLRRLLAKINALLLATRSQGFWGYVRTDQNPADKPSRWGCRVKSKFRDAKKSA
eukprot:Skav229097  [mRNA]  locus=scaffold92:258831:261649:- [translate_table: standard]